MHKFVSFLREMSIGDAHRHVAEKIRNFISYNQKEAPHLMTDKKAIHHMKQFAHHFSYENYDQAAHHYKALRQSDRDRIDYEMEGDNKRGHTFGGSEMSNLHGMFHAHMANMDKKSPEKEKESNLASGFNGKAGSKEHFIHIANMGRKFKHSSALTMASLHKELDTHFKHHDKSAPHFGWDAVKHEVFTPGYNPEDVHDMYISGTKRARNY